MLLTGFPCKASQPWGGVYAGGSDQAGGEGDPCLCPLPVAWTLVVLLPPCLPGVMRRVGSRHCSLQPPPPDPSSCPLRPTLKPPPRHELPTSNTPTTKATALWSQTHPLACPLGTPPAPPRPTPPLWSRPWPVSGPAPGLTRALSRGAENQSQPVSMFGLFSASALSQNGASSEVAEVLEVAEAGPEAAERVRKLPKESSGEGGWRISSQDSGKTGSKSV